MLFDLFNNRLTPLEYWLQVTIDIKTTSAGVVDKVLANVGDVVQPGKIVAVVGGSTGAQAAPAASTTTSTAASSISTSTSTSHGHRTPMIKFPPRMTPDGRRISLLPAAEADAVLAQIMQHSQPAAPVQAAPAAAATAPAAAKASAPKPSPQPAAGSKKSTHTTYMSQHPPRRTMTKTEMDMINLGGAMP